MPCLWRAGLIQLHLNMAMEKCEPRFFQNIQVLGGFFVLFFFQQRLEISFVMPTLTVFKCWQVIEHLLKCYSGHSNEIEWDAKWTARLQP